MKKLSFLLLIAFIFPYVASAATLTDKYTYFFNSSSLPVPLNDERNYACVPLYGCGASGTTTLATYVRQYVPESGTITKVVGSFSRVTGTAGSSEKACISVAVNGTLPLHTVDCDIDFSLGTASTYSFDELVDIPLAEGDYIAVVLTTPNFATNPSGTILWDTYLLFESSSSTLDEEDTGTLYIYVVAIWLVSYLGAYLVTRRLTD